ncbi:hypothetical protein [Helicobacter mustelae]|uniref:hypothetical protein n=1 Tax=Helicobacter mustelae TaxID=217 RepID=UPI0002D956F5|nr:hypothetical protein [Helicobacter mustelae]SQH71587.1 Uncharacterised protein [Helicobacter mustelae]
MMLLRQGGSLPSLQPHKKDGPRRVVWLQCTGTSGSIVKNPCGRMPTIKSRACRGGGTT